MIVKSIVKVDHEYRSHWNKDVKSKIGAATAVTHIEIKTECNKVNRLRSNLVLVAHGTCHECFRRRFIYSGFLGILYCYFYFI